MSSNKSNTEVRSCIDSVFSLHDQQHCSSSSFIVNEIQFTWSISMGDLLKL